MGTETREILNVTFIGDKEIPTKIAMLTRKLGRFGGGLVTGIGGHFEPDKDKTVLISAERELGEEVKDWAGTSLIEFARCYIGERKVIYYYWGVQDTDIPQADEREGTLEWVSIDRIVDENIFPTTRPVLEEWRRRGFSVLHPWTIWVSGTKDENGITQDVVVEKIDEGLQNL